MIGLFKLSIFLDSILTYCMFLEICPFLLGYPINWHLTHGSILCFWFFVLFFFCISMVSPLSVLTLFGSSLFFLVSLVKSLLGLFIFWIRKLLVFIVFFSYHFLSLSFPLCNFFLLLSLWGFLFLASIRDRTPTPWRGSSESQLLDH